MSYNEINGTYIKVLFLFYSVLLFSLMYSLNTYANKYNKYCVEDKKILSRGAKLYLSCL